MYKQKPYKSHSFVCIRDRDPNPPSPSYSLAQKQCKCVDHIDSSCKQLDFEVRS